MNKMPDRVFISGDAYEPEVLEQWSKRFTDTETEYIRADLVPQWIKCSDRLPDNGRWVTIGYLYNGMGASVEAMLSDANIWYGKDLHPIAVDLITVTHWHERLEYPKE